MNPIDIYEAIDRIRKMEECFDALLNTADGRFSEELAGVLEAYYTGGRWLRDYELDEKGLLPEGLKRGVLSEDGVYNLLAQIREERDKT